jgi:trans-aconitate methyltransferase
MILLTLPAPSVRHEERIGKLERDLAVLERIVEQLVAGMDAEHKAIRESRAEDRLALKELGEKMERSVASLADEMKRLAERNAAVDASVLAKQSQALGAIAVTRWIVGTALTIGALVLTYHAGQDSSPRQDRKPYHARLMQ